jgi:hypothetical protein
VVPRRLIGAVGGPMLLAPLTVLALLAGCGEPGSPSAAPGPERSAPTPPASPTGQTDTSAIESYAREHLPDVFAGIAVEQDGAVVVYRVPPAPEFDSAIRQQLGPTPVVLRDAARSERELQSITRQVLDDVDYWRGQGIEIHGAGPDFVRGVVEVLTPQADAALAPLRARTVTASPCGREPSSPSARAADVSVSGG